MNDNYNHFSSKIIYIIDNIPGPNKNDPENKFILDNFNSYLYSHCNCINECVEGKCSCLVSSAGKNYCNNNSGAKNLLNISKIQYQETYPVFECNSFCPCDTDCGNRVVQKGPILGLYVKKCENGKGYGLFINHNIVKGTFICIYAGEIITKSEAVIRHGHNSHKQNMNYIFCLKEHSNGHITETIVDPSTFGNIGRYVNHSCEPNCVIVPVRIDSPIPKLAIFSRVNINQGSEITIDYGSHMLSSIETICEKKNRTKCLCDSQLCRQWLPFEIY